MSGIILFDGECNFCNKSVQFIIKRDPHAYFKFASLQSDIGQKLLIEYGVREDVDSLVLLEGKTYYVKSTAALKICKNLSGFWQAGKYFLFLPERWRNMVYDMIAKNRYRFFGRSSHCLLPTPEVRKRFL
ncbi:thiol-disulfide oxidoreductase DCC family protein [Bacillus kwashiorkori]|uniref:thiol-disulfide oxidoreductase DCC family protein n=1 Tax=Bacillus kwashiorkori TaxID=1522318 RepID=UPI0007849ED1|nr:thiol-disulfide oxidoreductase DCC family protein [Bacillus kwashiorkori]